MVLTDIVTEFTAMRVSKPNFLSHVSWFLRIGCVFQGDAIYSIFWVTLGVTIQIRFIRHVENLHFSIHINDFAH